MHNTWKEWAGYAAFNILMAVLVGLILITVPGTKIYAVHKQPCEICPIDTCDDADLPHAPNPEAS